MSFPWSAGLCLFVRAMGIPAFFSLTRRCNAEMYKLGISVCFVFGSVHSGVWTYNNRIYNVIIYFTKRYIATVSLFGKLAWKYVLTGATLVYKVWQYYNIAFCVLPRLWYCLPLMYVLYGLLGLTFSVIHKNEQFYYVKSLGNIYSLPVRRGGW